MDEHSILVRARLLGQDSSHRRATHRPPPSTQIVGQTAVLPDSSVVCPLIRLASLIVGQRPKCVYEVASVYGVVSFGLVVFFL